MSNGEGKLDELEPGHGIAVECQEAGCGKNPWFRVIMAKQGTILICMNCGQGYGCPVRLPLQMRKAIPTPKGDPDAKESAPEGQKNGG
jgi:hypothetical protein